MLQFMLGIDLFICNWFIYLLTSLLFSVLLLLPTLTEKCQPVFELSVIILYVVHVQDWPGRRLHGMLQL